MANVIKRGNSYRITVSLGYDMNNKKIRETTTFTPDPHLTPKQEQKALDAFVYEFEKIVREGKLLKGEKITLAEYLKIWLQEDALHRLEPSTFEKYKFEITSKIIPELGYFKLSDLKPIYIQSFYNSLLKDGKRMDNKKGGYSSATIKKYHNILSSALKTAVNWQLIESNPCSKVSIPKQTRSRDDIKFFTPEETVTFLKLLESDLVYICKGHNRIDDTGKPYTVGDYTLQREIPLQLKVFFNLAVFGGFRNGELLALTWDDINFDKNTISITKAATLVEGKAIIKEPKTHTSVRVVSLPQEVMSMLKKHKTEQAEQILKLGSYWNNENLLFTQNNGKMMHYQTPYHKFKKIIEYYNKHVADETHPPLPDIPLHGLRHTSATLLISENVDVRTVSARLGHAQTSTTMNIYAHALKENDRIAADKLENLLKKDA